MSVWIICDANPNCDQHFVAGPSLRLPTGWTGTPWNAWCPDHAAQHIPF